MNGLMSSIVGMAISFKMMEEKCNETFKDKAEEARKKYWDACKYPRKVKKQMRKEAIMDYNFYTQLSMPVLYDF